MVLLNFFSKKNDVGEEAYREIRRGSNRKKLWKKYSFGYKKADEPVTFFMAGAPGSGKTEVIERYLRKVFENCVVADADEIRKTFVGYDGKNAYKFQRAASKGVAILQDSALKNSFNIIVDGTFSRKYAECKKSVEENLNKNRRVVIIYLYTHPKIAWTLAKKREHTERRKIGLRVFMKAFFGARRNVDRIKKEFGDKVYIVGMRNDYSRISGIGVGEIKVDIANVDMIQKIGYGRWSLLLRIMYVTLVLLRERILWTIKNLLKKLTF